jgi:hypothetical protein
MKENPIIFSGPMVRAILNGRKTQTRRIVKPQPDVAHDGEPYWNICGYRAWRHRSVGDMGGNKILCPYGVPGDRIWVKETWRRATPEMRTPDGIVYSADNLLIYFDGSSTKADEAKAAAQRWKMALLSLYATLGEQALA